MNLLIRAIKKINRMRKLSVVAKKTDSFLSSSASVGNCEFEGHNVVYAKADLNCCVIGRGTYIGMNCKIAKTKIGSWCSIGPNVRIVAGNHPVSDCISTYPAFYRGNGRVSFKTAVNFGRVKDFIKIYGNPNN